MINCSFELLSASPARASNVSVKAFFASSRSPSCFSTALRSCSMVSFRVAFSVVESDNCCRSRVVASSSCSIRSTLASEAARFCASVFNSLLSESIRSFIDPTRSSNCFNSSSRIVSLPEASATFDFPTSQAIIHPIMPPTTSPAMNIRLVSIFHLRNRIVRIAQLRPNGAQRGIIRD